MGATRRRTGVFLPGLYSLLLHAVLAAALVLTLEFDTSRELPAPPPERVVQAVSVDSNEVEQELRQIKEREQRKVAEQRRREEALKQKEREAARKEKRAEEEKRKAARVRKEAEEKRRQEEQKQRNLQRQRKEEEKKLAELKRQQKEAENQKKLEEERAKRAAAEKKRAEEEKKRVEEEKKRIELEKKQIEEEKKRAEAEKRKAAEEARKEKERLEEQRLEAQRRNDEALKPVIAGKIDTRVRRFFNQLNLEAGLTCELEVKFSPDGQVLDVRISRSSGSEIFDSRAITAVRKASPLPLQEWGVDLQTFKRINLENTRFVFNPW